MGLSAFCRSITVLALCSLAQSATAGASQTLRDGSTGERALGPSFGLKMGDIAFFGAYDSTQGGLWRSDGTSAGTRFLGGGEPATISNGLLLPSYGPSGAVIGNVLVYRGYTGARNAELWRTDGSVAGTSLLLDLHEPQPGFGSVGGGSTPGSCGAGFVSSGTYAFFDLISNGSRRLYRSDGTTPGTIEIGSFPGASRVCVLAFHGGTLYFEVQIFQPGLANPPGMLWRSNGEPGGHAQVTDASGAPLRAPWNMVEMNGALHFFSNSAAGVSLWRLSAGDPIPRPVLAPQPNTYDQRQLPVIAAVTGSALLFRAYEANPVPGAMLRLFRTDGTAAGTYSLSDAVSLRSLKPGGVQVGNRFFYFCAYGQTHAELCVTDGTSSGTTSIRISVPGYQSSRDPEFLEFDGEAYFIVDPLVSGLVEPEMWHSNGTSGGTRRVTGLTGFSRSGFHSYFAVAGEHLLFAGLDQADTEELRAYSPGSGGGGAVTWPALIAMMSLLAWLAAQRHMSRRQLARA